MREVLLACAAFVAVCAAGCWLLDAFLDWLGSAD